MSYPLAPIVAVTQANVWTKVQNSSVNMTGCTARSWSSNGQPVCIARLSKGSPLPTSTPWTGDQTDLFIIQSPGDNPYPMGSLAGLTVDLYVCALDGSAGAKTSFWPEAG